VWEDENSVMRHVVASGVTADLQCSIQKTETTLNLSAKDLLAAGDQTVPVIVETPKLGGDPLLEKLFSMGLIQNGYVQLRNILLRNFNRMSIVFNLARTLRS
jgi:hypothetical protein